MGPFSPRHVVSWRCRWRRRPSAWRVAENMLKTAADLRWSSTFSVGRGCDSYAPWKGTKPPCYEMLHRASDWNKFWPRTYETQTPAVRWVGHIAGVAYVNYVYILVWKFERFSHHGRPRHRWKIYSETVYFAFHMMGYPNIHASLHELYDR